MKNILFFLLIGFLFTAACKKDDDNGTTTPTCDTNDVAAVLAATWTETPILGVGGKVTFKSDKTGSCDNNSLFSTEVNGVTSNTFTWTLSADKKLLTLAYPNGTSLEYDVTKVECSKMVLSAFGFDITLTK